MNYEKFSDEYFMAIAMQEAQKAFDADEVPIGAVVVIDNKIIAKAHNQTELLNDVTAHAEIIAITTAEQNIGSKYLQNATLYVTVEPCVMCIGAIFWSKIKRLVYGASDEKFGHYKIQKLAESKNLSLYHPKLEVKSGVLADQAANLMKKYFQGKRKK